MNQQQLDDVKNGDRLVLDGTRAARATGRKNRRGYGHVEVAVDGGQVLMVSVTRLDVPPAPSAVPPADPGRVEARAKRALAGAARHLDLAVQELAAAVDLHATYTNRAHPRFDKLVKVRDEVDGWAATVERLSENPDAEL